MTSAVQRHIDACITEQRRRDVQHIGHAVYEFCAWLALQASMDFGRAYALCPGSDYPRAWKPRCLGVYWRPYHAIPPLERTFRALGMIGWVAARWGNGPHRSPGEWEPPPFMNHLGRRWLPGSAAHEKAERHSALAYCSRLQALPEP